MATDHIAVTGIEAFGFHGVLPHERQIGQRFIIDVTIGTDVREAAATDDINQTVDYGRLVDEVIGIVTGEPRHLIETVAEEIATVCLQHTRVVEAEITVHKPAAPVSAAVSDVAVTVRRSQ